MEVFAHGRHIGRSFTIATNQVDFAMPARFGLTYRDRDNSQKTPLRIYRAPLSAHERCIGFLIKSRSRGTGTYPPWLAPEQVRVLTLNDDEKLVAYAKEIHRRTTRTKSVPKPTSALTQSKPKSLKPKKPKSTPCW